MDWWGVVPLTANCSRQANEKEDMSECRGCINIALKTGKQGDSSNTAAPNGLHQCGKCGIMS